MLPAPSDGIGHRADPDATACGRQPVIGPRHLWRQRFRHADPRHNECLDQIEAASPVGLVCEPFAQRKTVDAGQIGEIDHPVGQFGHRQAEKSPSPQRCEVDLDAIRAAKGLDDDRSGIEPGGKAAEAVLVAGILAEPDGEGLAEADDQRDGQRGWLNHAIVAGCGLPIANQPGNDSLQAWAPARAAPSQCRAVAKFLRQLDPVRPRAIRLLFTLKLSCA